MKQTVIRALALCLAAAFAGAFAHAQDDGTKSRTTQPDPGQGAPGTAGATSRTTSGAYGAQAGQPVRLSKLMNSSIRSQQGETLGQVQDLIVDPGTGDIQFVVLSRSGTGATATTPGIGTTTTGNLVAVPWGLVRQSGTDQFTLNVDRTKLLTAPSFSSTTWPTMDQSWSQRINSHFGVEATGAPGIGTDRDIGTPGAPGTPRNPVTPGVPTTPGTPDINSPTPGTPSSPLPGRPKSGAGTPGAPGGTGTGGSPGR